MPSANRSRNKISKPNRRETIKTVLKSNGFHSTQQIALTLQGQIWRAMHPESDAPFVIKVTSKTLHNEGLTVSRRNGKSYEVDENIVKEACIVEYLNSFQKCPPSIIGYHGCFHSENDYYLLLQHGGTPLFDFVATAHELINENHLEIANWMKVVRIAFKQMIDAIQFMHSKNICHFDISLENMTLFNEPDIDVCGNANDLQRDDIDLQIKLIDFGLSEQFKTATIIVDKKKKKKRFVSRKLCGKTRYQSPEIVEQKVFDAAANDVWCAAVCLFTMCVGSAPWDIAHESDVRFKLIMHGGMKYLLKGWDKLKYFDGNEDALDLLQKIFQTEKKRIGIQEIRQHAWLQDEKRQ